MKRALGLVAGLSVVLLLWGLAGATSKNASTGIPQATKDQVLKVYGQLPLSFEANQGQANGQVKFLSRGRGYSLFLTPTEAVLVLREPVGPEAWSNRDAAKKALDTLPSKAMVPQAAAQTVLRMKLVGGNPAPGVVGLDRLPARVNYFVGNDPKKWQTHIPVYAKVKYQDVYPGVDLVYYGNEGQLEYDLIVAPGADPGVIRLAFEGADELRMDAEGNLILETPRGKVVEKAPRIYQDMNGVKQAVPGRYVLKGKNQVVFQVAAYDDSKPLVIDPVLSYSTYLGGSLQDNATGIAVDAAGNAYVTGHTLSTDFPGLGEGGIASKLGSGGGFFDAFVTKLSPTGSLLYSTYLGGSGTDHGEGIAVDGDGNAYVTGFTNSTDFPGPSSTPSTLGPGGLGDVFVVKLNATGTALVYSTLLGGSNLDDGASIALDAEGNAYITGTTFSTNFPTTAGAFDTTCGTPASPCTTIPSAGIFIGDAFVAKLNAAGNALVYSTYLGGSGSELGFGIAVDGDGNAYVTGHTESIDFPTAGTPLQGALGGSFDAFVAKIDPSSIGAASLVYSTYLGGSNFDEARGIAVDGAGNAYVTGVTDSTNFPTSGTPFQGTSGGFSDAFVTKVNATGSLVYSTYLGGSHGDEGFGIAVDASGNAYVTGRTGSLIDFPRVNAFQLILRGPGFEAFVTKLNQEGSALVYSTYLGGSAEETGLGIVVDGQGNAYVTGATASTDFPTVNPLQPTYGGGGGFERDDAFVAKLGRLLTPLEQVQVLIDEVGFAASTAGLTSGQVNSLIAKLEEAIRRLDKGQENPAIKKLQDFINQVNALMGTGRFQPGHGEALIIGANDVIDRLRG